MDLLKEIGAILGFVAFGGLAILAFLTFLLARHLWRLRDWAGRQPERAAAEAERVAELAGEATIPSIERPEPEPEAEDRGPSRLDRFRGEGAVRMEEFNRHSPVDPKILAGGLLAVLAGVGIATSGFGLIGGGSSEGETTTAESTAATEETVEVAVLNATAPEAGAVGVDGVAERAGELVEDAGYEVGAVETAPGPFTVSVVMFEEGSKSDARELSSDLEESLAETEIEVITPEIQDLSRGADLALVVGQDDAGL